MAIFNFTPHRVCYDDGVSPGRIFESVGVVRLEMATIPDGSVDGMGVVRVVYGGISVTPEMPNVRPGDTVIVSTLAAEAVASRYPELIVLAPDSGPSAKRDANGNVISVSQFIRKG